MHQKYFKYRQPRKMSEQMSTIRKSSWNKWQFHMSYWWRLWPMARDQCQTGFSNFLGKHMKNISTLNKPTKSIASHDPITNNYTELQNVKLSKMVYINYLFLLKVFHLVSYLAPAKPKEKTWNQSVHFSSRQYICLHLVTTSFVRYSILLKESFEIYK